MGVIDEIAQLFWSTLPTARRQQFLQCYARKYSLKLSVEMKPGALFLHHHQQRLLRTKKRALVKEKVGQTESNERVKITNKEKEGNQEEDSSEGKNVKINHFDDNVDNDDEEEEDEDEEDDDDDEDDDYSDYYRGTHNKEHIQHMSRLFRSLSSLLPNLTESTTSNEYFSTSLGNPAPISAKPTNTVDIIDTITTDLASYTSIHKIPTLATLSKLSIAKSIQFHLKDSSLYQLSSPMLLSVLHHLYKDLKDVTGIKSLLFSWEFLSYAIYYQSHRLLFAKCFQLMFDVAAAKQNANLQTVVNEDGADLPVFQEKVVPELELIEDTVLSLILNVMKKIETSSLVLHSFEEVEHHLKTALELAIVFEELRWGMVASEVLNVCDQFLTLLMSLSVTKGLSQQSQDVFYYQSKFVILSKKAFAYKSSGKFPQSEADIFEAFAIAKAAKEKGIFICTTSLICQYAALTFDLGKYYFSATISEIAVGELLQVRGEREKLFNKAKRKLEPKDAANLKAHLYSTVALKDSQQQVHIPVIVQIEILRQACAVNVAIRHFKIAKRCIHKALLLLNSHFEIGHPFVALTLADYGHFLLSTDEVEIAVAVLQYALSLLQKNFGTLSPHVANLCCDLGYAQYVCNYSHGSFDSALLYSTRCVRIRLNYLPPDHIYLTFGKRVLGLILEEVGISAQADDTREAYLQDSYVYQSCGLKVCLETFGEKCLMSAKCYGNLGRLFQTFQNYEESEKNHLKAIEIKTELLGENDSEVALSVGHLASLYNYDMERYDEAEKLYLRSIQIGMELFGPRYSGFEYDYSGLVHLYTKTGRPELARKYDDKLVEWERMRSETTDIMEVGATSDIEDEEDNEEAFF